jgi:GNAT superfamily N-acetyltransferase
MQPLSGGRHNDKSQDNPVRNGCYFGTELPEFPANPRGGPSHRGLQEMTDLRGSSASGRRRSASRQASRRLADIEPTKISLRIRRVRPADVARVVALDKRVTGLAKARYWQDIFKRYGSGRPRDRFFLMAEPLDRKAAPRLLGFIIGEVRAWEFGSSPCGWIFALSVEPGVRLQGIGEALFNAISTEFRGSGVAKVRTMVARDASLTMVFFRSQGMVAGPYIQLEMDLG